MRAVITMLEICGNCAQARFHGLLYAAPNTLRIICTFSRLISTPKCNNTRSVNTFTTENEPFASHAFCLLTNTGRLVFFLSNENGVGYSQACEAKWKKATYCSSSRVLRAPAALLSPERGCASSLPQSPFLPQIRRSQQLRFRTVKIIYDVYISKVCQLFQAIKPT